MIPFNVHRAAWPRWPWQKRWCAVPADPKVSFEVWTWTERGAFIKGREKCIELGIW